MRKVLLAVGLIFIAVGSFASSCKTVKTIDTSPYQHELANKSVTFIALDFTNKNCWVINKGELKTRFSPFSTFKIPHTLIALETGAAKSLDQFFQWDPVKYPPADYWPKTWKQPHSLRSAYKQSAAWYYQELVPQIGVTAYRKWLKKFSYGNKAVTPGNNHFWLGDELKISTIEQLDFLVCLLESRCGIESNVLNAFEEIALQDSSFDFKMYAKTGAGPTDANNLDRAFEGWYVGYIKNGAGKSAAAFALHVTANSFSELQNFRQAFSKQLLTDLGFWALE